MTVTFWHGTHPLGGMVEHFLPGRVKLAAVLLEQPLLGQGDGLLGGPQDLHRPLELLGGLLGFHLGLKEDKRTCCMISYVVSSKKNKWISDGNFARAHEKAQTTLFVTVIGLLRRTHRCQ